MVDAYALALAALLMGIGSISDIVGHRKAYIAGLALFAASSLVCGIAPNVGSLIAARAVQGVGAAAMFATTFALLNSSYAGRDRGTAYGMWGAVAGAAAAIGPIFGGLLTEGLSWRWIFFVNLPISIAAIALCLRVLSGDRPEGNQRVDLPGMATFTLGAAAVTFASIRASDDGWSSWRVLGLLALSAVAFLTFVIVERRSDHALLDLSLFKSRSFVGIMIAALLLNFAAFAYFTYTSIWLQSLLGLSPIQSGLTGLPLSISAFLVSALIGRFLHKSAAGPIIGGGLLLIGVGGIVSGLLVGSGSSWPALVLGFLIVGVGVGLGTPTLSSSAMASVTPATRRHGGGGGQHSPTARLRPRHRDPRQHLHRPGRPLALGQARPRSQRAGQRPGGRPVPEGHPRRAGGFPYRGRSRPSTRPLPPGSTRRSSWRVALASLPVWSCWCWSAQARVPLPLPPRPGRRTPRQPPPPDGRLAPITVGLRTAFPLDAGRFPTVITAESGSGFVGDEDRGARHHPAAQR